MNLNALIEEYNQQEKSRDWVACVIWPLAEEMASRFGMKASVVGPCGLASRVFIKLFDTDLEMEGDRFDVGRKFLIVRGDFDENGNLMISYEPGEKITRYLPGTLGEVNGFNMMVRPLPNSLDEVAALFKYIPPISYIKNETIKKEKNHEKQSDR